MSQVLIATGQQITYTHITRYETLCWWWVLETDGIIAVVQSCLPDLLDLDTEQMMETQWFLVLRKFMTCVETMDLFQVIRGSRHTGSHTLDLGFISRHDLEDIVINLVVIKSMLLTAFQLIGAAPPCREIDPKQLAWPRKVMDPAGFQSELGVFPKGLVNCSTEAMA